VCGNNSCGATCKVPSHFFVRRCDNCWSQPSFSGLRAACSSVDLDNRLGDKTMLVLTLLIMGSATTLIGTLSACDSIGILAPILLVTLWAIQTLAVQQLLFTEMFGTERRRDDQLRNVQETYLRSFQADLISFQSVARILGPAADTRRVEV
jgi:hypothetical protein